MINTIGPAQRQCLATNPALAARAPLELAAPDPLGLGLATAVTCKTVGAAGLLIPAS